MNDIYITLSGNVIAEPRQFAAEAGPRVTSLRVASTPRLYDKPTQSWYDGETSYYVVRCYRVLAENVARSVKAGQPVVVHGKLRIRSLDRDGQRRSVAEVEAVSVGHDLRRGVSVFDRPQRTSLTPAPALSSGGKGTGEHPGQASSRPLSIELPFAESIDGASGDIGSSGVGSSGVGPGTGAAEAVGPLAPARSEPLPAWPEPLPAPEPVALTRPAEPETSAEPAGILAA
ncbi:hypothetical protein Ssi03_21000 [Sphaerisporangium siamense]|uniref:Single-strand DNA-binding protein n=1 Tax=Sphaerisporangium siamense TaxID=795645 RepID=A0A7W7GA16_9ACTN|nr:single-stranded DNA-binding protein [Sphaerisporangium siamense]MBB4701977.1 single-strand DNA-binding protein [Sphaerisporangium siamense]GII84110.1 hypothetical protein Ssi03_21000 [Sphaerisporangium siamense]